MATAIRPIYRSQNGVIVTPCIGAVYRCENNVGLIAVAILYSKFFCNIVTINFAFDNNTWWWRWYMTAHLSSVSVSRICLYVAQMSDTINGGFGKMATNNLSLPVDIVCQITAGKPYTTYCHVKTCKVSRHCHAFFLFVVIRRSFRTQQEERRLWCLRELSDELDIFKFTLQRIIMQMYDIELNFLRKVACERLRVWLQLPGYSCRFI